MGLNTAAGAVQLVACAGCWVGGTTRQSSRQCTLGCAGQSAGRGLTSVEQRVWPLTHMQGAVTECSDMMQRDHDI